MRTLEETKAEISKSDIENYYVTEEHTWEQTRDHFNLCTATFDKLLREYGISKRKVAPISSEELEQLVTYEELYDYYIIQDNSPTATCKHFNLKGSHLNRLLKKWNLFKGKGESIRSVEARVSRESLETYYLVEKHSRVETCEHFNITKCSLQKLLGIYKLGRNTKIADLKARISPSELKDYYITQDHTPAETAEHFDLSLDRLNELLKQYKLSNVKTSELDKAVSRVTVEELGDFYRGGERTVEEVRNHFNLSRWVAYSLLKYYGIERNAETLEDVARRVSAEELHRYFIEENHTQADTCSHFNISLTRFMSLKQLYGIEFKREPFEQMLDRAEEVEVRKLFTEDNLSRSQIGEKLDIPISSINKIFKLYSIDPKRNCSHYESDLAKYLPESLELRVRDKVELGGQELDLYLPQLKLGIEFNGDYWHSDLFKDKSYHFNKSKLAEERGIRLIHIYEYEWLNPVTKAKIISMLNIATGNTGTRIYARNCEIKQISNAEARPFNDVNHLQGHRNAQVTYGLFYKGELVQLMSFSKTRYNRNLKVEGSWEIIRGCPGSNNVVVGGVSRLFKHFVQDYKPTQVFSYCDFNKFDGRGYEALGMKFIGYTGPDLNWVLDFSRDIVVPRQPSKHKEMQEKAVAKIWGAGSKKYLWTAPDNGEQS